MYFPSPLPTTRLSVSTAAVPVGPSPALKTTVYKTPGRPAKGKFKDSLGGVQEEEGEEILSIARGPLSDEGGSAYGRRPTLWVALGREELSVWSVRPKVVLAKVRRTPISLRTHGSNAAVQFHGPDRIVVTIRVGNAFAIKATKEVVLQDSRKATVFLSQGILRNEEDVAVLYEEYCYKQYKLKEHSTEVHAASGLQVGKRDLIGSLGLTSLGSLKSFQSTGSEPNGAGLFSPGSFMDSLANDSPLDADSFFADATPSTNDSSDDKHNVETMPHNPDSSSTDSKVDAVNDKKALVAAYVAGQGEAPSADGNQKRTWSWRRFVMRSEEHA